MSDDADWTPAEREAYYEGQREQQHASDGEDAMITPFRARVRAIVQAIRENMRNGVVNSQGYWADRLDKLLAEPEAEDPWREQLHAAVHALDPAAADDQPYGHWDAAKWAVFNAAVRFVKDAEDRTAALAEPEAEALSPHTIERVVTAIRDDLGMLPDPWPNDDQLADFCQRVSRSLARAAAPEPKESP